MEEAKKMKCYKRLIYKQFFQVSDLCGPQLLSFFSETFHAPLYRFGAPIWPPGNQRKHLEFTFSIKAFSFLLRTSILAHKLISNTWNGHTTENQEEWLFQRDSIPVLVSRTVKTRKFKFLYFRSETCCGNGNLYKDLLFVYLEVPKVARAFLLDTVMFR